MFVRSKDETLQAASDGLVSHILLQEGDVGSDQLLVTWVEVDPGSRQVDHSHEPEQVYVLVNGEGRMRVGDETRRVGEGDLVYIPSNVDHGIENTGEDTLVYISAGTPTMDVRPFYDLNDADERT